MASGKEADQKETVDLKSLVMFLKEELQKRDEMIDALNQKITQQEQMLNKIVEVLNQASQQSQGGGGGFMQIVAPLLAKLFEERKPSPLEELAYKLLIQNAEASSKLMEALAGNFGKKAGAKLAEVVISHE